MHCILHKAGFPAHLLSHTAVHLPPFFLAGTTRFSTESGSGAGDAHTLMAVNSRHSAKAATIKANVERFMSIPIDAPGAPFVYGEMCPARTPAATACAVQR